MKFRRKDLHFLVLKLIIAVCVSTTIQAQWITQTFNLVPGWNAVYLHVDTTYDTLDHLIGGDTNNPIVEVWQWQAAPATAQFVKDPSTPTTGNSQWASWDRSLGPASVLHRMAGNIGYLVHATNAYTWKLKGKAVAPSYLWTSTGLNFIGFPTPGTNAPSVDGFLSFAPDFEQTAQIFYYPGGPLGTNNPAALFNFAGKTLRRGEAFWIRSPNFNSYYGPVQVVLGSASGIDFGDAISQISFRIKNQTSSNLVVTLQLLASEASPTNQPSVVAAPPVILRGTLNTTNLTYDYSVLNTNRTIQLAPAGQPGSDTEIVLGLNRAAMAFAPGAQVGGILRITDSFQLSQIDLPVSAAVSSPAGLWIGSASVSKVNQYLTSYYTVQDAQGLSNLLSSLNLTNGMNGVTYSIDPVSSRVVALTTNSGSFLAKNLNTNTTPVVKPYPLRMILHNGTNGQVHLLQRAYVGFDPNTNQIVAVNESFLDPLQLSTARRVSCTHLPWSPGNTFWTVNGTLAPGNTLSFPVALSYADQASNPFLHTYHPDHDNLDAQFATVLGPGAESYSVNRTIRFQFIAPGNDFASLTSFGTTLIGTYSETLTLAGGPGQLRNFDVSGAFKLNRITSTPTLTTP
jgi:hypothetical protein